MLGILIEYRIVDMQGQNAIWRQGRKNLIFCDSPQGQAPNVPFNPPAVDPARPTDRPSALRGWPEKREAIFRRSITKTGGGDDIGHLEEGNLKALRNISIEMKAIVGNQYARYKDDRDIGPQFLIFKEGLEFSDHKEVVEIKVNPKDQDPDTDQIGN